MFYINAQHWNELILPGAINTWLLWLLFVTISISAPGLEHLRQNIHTKIPLALYTLEYYMTMTKLLSSMSGVCAYKKWLQYNKHRNSVSARGTPFEL